MTRSRRARAPKRTHAAKKARTKTAPAPPTAPTSKSVEALADRLAGWTLWLLILVPPLVLDFRTKDNFRLPKELVSEVLVLVSLVFLCFRLRRVGRIEWGRLLRRPVVAASLPLFAVASLGWLVTEHPLHFARGWSSLAVGVLALVGWGLALSPEEKRRLLSGTVVPATLLALLAVVQSHELFIRFEFEGRVSARLGLTSLAGGAFDLSAYLVLPALLAQIGLYAETRPRRRAGWGLALALFVYAMARTQTLTALAALAAASAVLWAVLLPRRRLAAVAAALAVVGGALVIGVEPLRVRLANRVQWLGQGEVNQLLTGRLDPWWTALHMLERHPWLGVGTGAFTAEFAPAKLELEAQGVRFFAKHREAHFNTAHNEFLEVAAECGGLGLLALGWGLWVLALRLHRFRPNRSPPDKALAASGAAALGVMAMTSFPMHLAIVAYPHLLLLGWILERQDPEEEEPRP